MKLRVTQPVATVNAIEQTSTWCVFCGNSGHSIDIYAANPKFIIFVGNIQRLNYGNVYNLKWKTHPLNQ